MRQYIRMLVVAGWLVPALVCAQVRQIEKTSTIDAPVDVVWKAWATSDGLRSWLAADAKVDLRLNGAYEIAFDTTPPPGLRGSEGCQVLSFIPQRMLSFSWNAPPSQPTMRLRRTFVVLEFAPTADGKTNLKLTHGGWHKGAEWDETYAYFDNAWGRVLELCKEKVRPGLAAPPKGVQPPATYDDPALKAISRMIGGIWRGEVKDEKGKPVVIEFRYRRHEDGVGVVGEGWIGKGRKDAVRVKTQFGYDPITRTVYYWDSHGSGTVYWGHVAAEKNDVVFVFGPAGGDMSAFSSRSRFADNDTLSSIIRNAQGQEVVGLSLKRYK